VVIRFYLPEVLPAFPTASWVAPPSVRIVAEFDARQRDRDKINVRGDSLGFLRFRLNRRLSFSISTRFSSRGPAIPLGRGGALRFSFWLVAFSPSPKTSAAEGRCSP